VRIDQNNNVFISCWEICGVTSASKRLHFYFLLLIVVKRPPRGFQDEDGGAPVCLLYKTQLSLTLLNVKTPPKRIHVLTPGFGDYISSPIRTPLLFSISGPDLPLRNSPSAPACSCHRCETLIVMTGAQEKWASKQGSQPSALIASTHSGSTSHVLLKLPAMQCNATQRNATRQPPRRPTGATLAQYVSLDECPRYNPILSVLFCSFLLATPHPHILT